MAIMPGSISGERNIMAITKEILDELLKDYQKPEDLLGQSGLLQQLSKALLERVLDGELTHQLGYEKYASAGKNSGNSRNGNRARHSKVNKVPFLLKCRVIATASLSHSLSKSIR